MHYESMMEKHYKENALKKSAIKHYEKNNIKKALWSKHYDKSAIELNVKYKKNITKKAL